MIRDPLCGRCRAEWKVSGTPILLAKAPGDGWVCDRRSGGLAFAALFTKFRSIGKLAKTCRRFPNLLYRRFPNRQSVPKLGAPGERTVGGLGNPRYSRLGSLRYSEAACPPSPTVSPLAPSPPLAGGDSALRCPDEHAVRAYTLHLRMVHNGGACRGAIQFRRPTPPIQILSIRSILSKIQGRPAPAHADGNSAGPRWPEACSPKRQGTGRTPGRGAHTGHHPNARSVPECGCPQPLSRTNLSIYWLKG
jgi:hypothetical protein